MDEETKKAIADAVAEATKGLKDKNAELIGEVRTLKQEKQAAEEAAEEAANEAATKAGDIDSIKASLEKKHATELKKLNDQVSKLTGEISTYKIDSVISKAIADNAVKPTLIPLVESYLKNGATIENGEALVNGVPLADHISSYFASEAAKDVALAPANSGGGATGSTTKVSSFTKMPETQEEWDKFYVLAENNKEAADAHLKTWGLS